MYHDLAQLDATAQKEFGALGPAWEELCPAPLLPNTVLVRHHRGVLRVGVRDSATLFSIQRAATPAFRDALAQKARVTLRTIEFRITDDLYSRASTP